MRIPFAFPSLLLLCSALALPTGDAHAGIRLPDAAQSHGPAFHAGFRAVPPAVAAGRQRLVFLVAASGDDACGMTVRVDGLPAFHVPVSVGERLRAASFDLAPWRRDGAVASDLRIELEPEGACVLVPGTLRLWDGEGDASVALDPRVLEPQGGSAAWAGPTAPSSLVEAPVSWPAESIGAGAWTVYSASGTAINDGEGGTDPSTGGTTPQSDSDISSAGLTRPSVFFAYDDVNAVFFYRMRVKAEPLTPAAVGTGTNLDGSPWDNVTWNLLVDMDTDGWKEFTVVLDGGSGGGSRDILPSGDDLKVYFNDKPVQTVTVEAVSKGKVTTPNDLVWYTAAGTHPATVPLNPEADGATYDFGRTRRVRHTAANSTWGDGYFIDFQFPLSAFTASYFGADPVVRANTPVTFGYSTANSNTNPLQKDFASRYSYTAGASTGFPFSDVVTLATGISQPPLVGGFAVSGINCPTSATLSIKVADELEVDPPTSGSGQVTDTLQDLLFEFYFDADENGLPDDGGNWTSCATVGASLNPDTRGDRGPDGTTLSFNDWGVVWNTSSLAQGQYLLRVTARDEQANTTQKTVGSYRLVTGDCRAGSAANWASFSDPDHLVPEEDFSAATGDTVHGFSSTLGAYTAYKIAWYDANGDLIETDTGTTDLFGNLDAELALAATAPVGVWHSVVYPYAATPPGSYNGSYDPDTNPIVADDGFNVVAPPPPDPPAVDSPLLAGATTITGTSIAPAGSTLTVFVDGTEVGQTTVRADGTWTLNGVTALVADQRVEASVNVGGSESALSPPVIVAADSADVTPAPIVTSPILAGATTISGTSPSPNGTRIDVYVDGVAVGQATVTAGAWTLSGIAALVEVQVVDATATETGKGTSGPSAPVVVAASAGDVSDAPVIDGPLTSGSTSVSGTSTESDGTIIAVLVNGQWVGQATVSGGTWTLSGLSTPLAVGDIVRATATAPGEGTSPLSAPEVVKPSAPTVNSPIIAGATSVSGTSLEPVGTTITVYVNGVAVGTTTVQAGGTWTRSGLAPLVAGQQVTATNTVGTVEGPPSPQVTVAPSTGSTPSPTVSSPLLDGATAVSGTSTSPDGTLIEVYVDGVKVGETTVVGGNWTLTGIAPLAVGQEVTATATETGMGTSPPSAPVTVQPVAPVVDSPITQNDTVVSGTSTYADGTQVTVYVNGAPVGSASVSGGVWTLSGIPALSRNDVVTATQTVSGIASPLSDPVVVSNPGQTSPPPFVTSPILEGATVIRGTSTSANGTTIFVYVDGVSVGTTTVTGGDWSLVVGALEAGQVVFAKAKETNRGTSGPSNTVIVSPAPPVVDSPAFAGDTTISGTSTAPAGSTITVSVDGSVVGTTTVSSDGTWTLDGVAALTDGQSLTATVTVGTVTSIVSPAVIVAADPDDVTPAPVITSPVTAGATSIAGTSISPNGTSIDVFVDGIFSGRATVTAGAWSLAGVGPLSDGQVLTAVATEPGKGTSGPSAEVVVGANAGDTTPAPVVSGPLLEGETAVSGTSTSPDGTVIDVFVGGVPVGSTTVSGGQWTLAGLSPALVPGEAVTATATEPGKGTSAPAAPVIVTPAPPIVDSPLFAGATTVTGTSTSPAGTTITVSVNSVPVGSTTVAGDGTWMLTGLATALVAGDAVSATATRNATTSAPSPDVIVSAPAGVSPAPSVDSPLLAGASTIAGASSSPDGTRIDVYVDGVFVGTTTVTGGNWTLTGVQPLVAGQQVWATATESGLGTSGPSGRVIVGEAGNLSPSPTVTGPLFDTETSVSGTSPSPDGTRIDVYADGAFIGSTTVSGGSWTLSGLSSPLAAGQQVTATATATGKGTSAPSAPVPVVPIPPVVSSPIITGATSVSGTSVEPIGTTITVYVNGAPVGTTTVQAGGTWTLGGLAPLASGQVVTATATVNTIESAPSAPVTVAATASPAPVVTAPIFDGATAIVGSSVSPNGTRIDVYVDGAFAGSTAVTAGAWTLSGVGSLAAGQVVTATATETGKGTSPASAPVIVVPLPPVVDSPLFAGATSVSGTSIYPDGTVVEVLVNGTPVGTTTVAGGTWTLTGLASPLSDGQRVTARQTVAGETSPVSPDVVVASGPADLTPPPTVTSPLLAGAVAIAGSSTSPDGARIDVFVDGVFRGSITVNAGAWTLSGLREALSEGQVVTAVATETGKGTSVLSAEVVVGASAADLTTPPVVDGPIYTGDTSVSGTSTFPDGTVIDVFVDGVHVGTTTVTGHTWELEGIGPLAAGDAVTATATGSGFGTSAPSVPVVVEPTPPVVTSPIAAGATVVSGTSAEAPGTTITVHVDGVPVGTTTVQPGGTWTRTGLTALVAGQVVTATATVGTTTSALSAAVVVSGGSTTPAPVVTGPLFDGATRIEGTSTSPDGTIVDVFVDGVPVGTATVSSGAWTLSEIGPLFPGQDVTATATEAGKGTSGMSASVIVLPLPPAVESPILTAATSVSGTSTYRDGTTVDVYVDGVRVGSATVTAGVWTLTVLPPLATGDVITARNVVNGTSSLDSAPVVVSPTTTVAPVVDAPLYAGETTVTGTSATPDGTRIDVLVDGVFVGQTTVVGGAWTLTGLAIPLVAGQQVTATATEAGKGTSPLSAPVTVVSHPPLVTTPLIAGDTAVSGTSDAPPGSVITVYVDGVPVGTTTVNANGTWSLSGIPPLAAGESVTATVTVNGTPSPASPPVEVAPVTGATPPPAILGPVYTGADIIHGTSTAPDGTVVTVYVNDVPVGTAVVAGGEWTLAGIGPLAAGDELTATARQPGRGTSGPSAPVVVEPKPPIVDSPLIEGATTITGTSEEPPGTIVTVFVNGLPVGTTSVSGTGTWTLAGVPPLVAEQSVTATVTVGTTTSDPSSAVIVAPLTGNTPPPVVTAPLFTGDTRITGTSTAPEGTLIEVFVNGLAIGFTTVVAGAWELEGIDALFADDQVFATATAPGRGTSAPSNRVVVQPNPPLVTSPITAGATSISGRSTEVPGSTITVIVNGTPVGTAVVQADGSWTLTGIGPLAAGQVVTATVTVGTLLSGPSAPVVVSGGTGTTPPPVVVGALFSGDTAVGGTSTSPDGTRIDIYVDGVFVGQTVVAGGVWGLSGMDALLSGQVVTATATQPGFGTSVLSNAVVVQPHPPVVGSPLLEGETTVSGYSVEPPGSVITVYADGVGLGTTVVQADGSWTLTGTAVLVAGQNITATVTAGGITSALSAPVVVGVSVGEITPPPVVTGPIAAGATTISGTSTSPAGTRIDVYVDGIFVGTTTVQPGGTWTLTGVGPLVSGQMVTATATETGKGTSPASGPVVVGGLPDLLRNDDIAALAPLAPGRPRVFTERYGEEPALDPLGSKPVGNPGEGTLTAFNGSDDDDDFYAASIPSPWIDPDSAVLTDRARPVVFYELLDGGANKLYLVKSGSTVALTYQP